MGLRLPVVHSRVGDMNNAAAKSTVATLIICPACYDAATVATPKPTNAQRDAEAAMMAKVGYYSRGGDRFYSPRDGEVVTCGICFADVDIFTVLWGSPDN